MTFRNPSDDELRNLLLSSRTIAVVGCSPKADRESHQIAAALQKRGYRIIPVHPAGGTILGETVYPALESIPKDIRVDIVDVFRRSEETVPVAQSAVAIGARALWLQLGVYNEEAAAAAQRAGLTCVMDLCIKVMDSLLVGSGDRS